MFTDAIPGPIWSAPLLSATHKVNGRILWANLHLLFWLSLIPFVTSYMGENHFTAVPVAIYGVVLIMCALAYTFLARSLVAYHGQDSTLALALGNDYKGTASLILYAAAIPLAFVDTRISMTCYVLVAIMWFVPDRRIEKALPEE